MFKKLQNLYLSWVNEFISLERFAEYYGMTEERANRVVNVGRDVHERHVRRLKKPITHI